MSYLLVNKKTYKFNLNSNNYFLYKKKKKPKSLLNYYFFFFIVIVFLEFFTINFNIYITKSDIFHDGAYLVPPLNYLNNNKLFNSTLYDYGIISHNIGLISKFFLGYYTLGSIKFIQLLLTLTLKIFLIIILKIISEELILNNFLKKLFFIILAILTINMPDYYDSYSYFHFRQVIYIFFIFILGSTLCSDENLNLKFFIIGNFSLISMLWWLDIGLYVNCLIILCLFYKIIHKEIKNIIFLILGITVPWIIFFLILPTDEIKEFITQVKFIYSDATQYLLGIEYRKPFSAKSGRWTTALLLIYVTSLMLVNLNFSRKYYISYKTKIFVNLLFISGMLIFNSALMRSDSYHLKYSSGLYTLVFLIIIILFLFQRLEKSIKIKNLIKLVNKKNLFKKVFFIFPIISLFIIIFFNNSYIYEFKKKIENIKSFKKNISNLIDANNNLYLDETTDSILKYYKEISKGDNCIQIFTDDTAFPFFLEKPSCTKYYFTSKIVKGYTEKDFIKQLKLASPNIILYRSPNQLLLNYSNMPEAESFINKEYSFFKNYKNFVFYKKKS